MADHLDRIEGVTWGVVLDDLGSMDTYPVLDDAEDARRLDDGTVLPLVLIATHVVDRGTDPATD